MRHLSILLLQFGLILSLNAQISFTNNTGLLENLGKRSGVAIGIVDVNGDGLDDVVRLGNASNLVIDYQQAPNETFLGFDYGNAGPGTEWAMCVADVNKDGYNDILVSGAYNDLKVFLMDSLGVDSLFELEEPSIFSQGTNFADINNDGFIDIFSCHDDGVSSAYENMQGESFVYNLDLINTATPIPSDNSGNYGSLWTDYDSDGDLDMYLSKCKLGETNSTAPTRMNLLWENDGNNNFSDVSVDKGLRPYAQSWAADFADIDNDGDMDAFIINHDSVSMLYENIDNQFICINNTSGIENQLEAYLSGIQCVFDDFDNDGLIDLIVTGVGSHFMFKNNGNKTFTEIVDAIPTTYQIHTAAVGDLNNDGFLDLICSYPNGYNSPANRPDKLFLNSANDNNWVKINLEGVESNINGIGARIEIYGEWGIQIREVRSGEGYGIMNSLNTHFGIGESTSIEKIVIKWPSGRTNTIWSPSINTNHNVIENVSGCDPTIVTGPSIVACDSALLNGYYYTVSQTVVDSFNDVNGCDSIVHTSVVVNISYKETIEETICNGDSATVNGFDYYHDAGVHEETYPTTDGCDSVITLDLTVNSLDLTINEVFLTGGSNGLVAQQENATYQWIDCADNESIVGATDQTFGPSENGSYAVAITKDGCTEISDCYPFVLVGFGINELPFDINIHPNPFSDNLQIKVDPNLLANLSYKVFDSKGTLVKEAAIESAIQTIELGHLAKGVYYIEISDGINLGSEKVIKF